jgi:uncharacterized protein
MRELEEADVAIHAGDFAAAGVHREIAQLCRGRLIAVHGNVDDPDLRRCLPERIKVELRGVRVGVIHDAGPARGRLARLRQAFPDVDAVVFGHSHLPLHERDGSFQIFNPGSPTERRRAPARTMGVATIRGGRIRFRHLRLG